MEQLKVLKELDFERLAGTPGEKRGRDVLLKYLDSFGLGYEIEAFDIFTFETGTAEIEVAGRRYPLSPYGLEESRELSGELCFVENADVLEYNTGAYKDKIILSYTASKRIADLVIGSGAAAYIGISPPFKEHTSLSHRQKIYSDKVAIPSATVLYKDAERLLKQSGKSAIIRINQKVSKRKAHNVVVLVGEAKRDDTLTYLVGHYDTVARSHGSVDNAGGTVCLLKAAEAFSKKPPERQLKIIFFSGEELGLTGSFDYVSRHEDEIHKRAKLVVNVDLSGDVIGHDQLYIMGTRELMGYAGGIARENGIMYKEMLSVYSSDGIPFSVHEIPSVNIARGGGSAIHNIHTAGDVAKNVSAVGLKNSYIASMALLKRTLSADIYPIKKALEDSLKDRIESYVWHALREKPDLKWKEKYKR